MSAESTRGCSSSDDAFTSCCWAPLPSGASITIRDAHTATDRVRSSLIPGLDTGNCLNDAAQNVGHPLEGHSNYLLPVHAPRHRGDARPLACRLNRSRVVDEHNLPASNPQPPGKEEVKNQRNRDIQLSLLEREKPAHDVEGQRIDR